jgi:hypothetical protein
MNRRTRIEIALERSLRNQVKAPPLDRRFDAKVWERIEAQATPAKVAQPASRIVVKAGRWLNIANVIGMIIVAGFVSFLGAPMLEGADLAISLPPISAADADRVMMVMSMSIAGAAVLFGLWFTPWGRRIRDELI